LVRTPVPTPANIAICITRTDITKVITAIETVVAVNTKMSKADMKAMLVIVAVAVDDQVSLPKRTPDTNTTINKITYVLITLTSNFKLLAFGL